MQQAGMVIVPRVLGVELPVGADALPRVAEHRYRFVQDTFDLADNRRAEIVLKRLGVLRQGAEDRAVDAFEPQSPQSVAVHIEGRVEPALAAHPAAERDRRQAAVEPVAPLVVDAHMLGRVAGHLAPHQRAAMGAPVDEGLDFAIAVAVDNDRCIADPGGTKVAGIGDFRVEDQIAPCRAAEDRLLLAGVKLRVVIKPVRNPAVVVPRPDRGIDHYHSVLRSRYSILRRFDLGDKCLHSGPGSAGRPGTTRIVGFQTESTATASRSPTKPLSRVNTVEIVTPGAGGYGPPASRAPDAVARDLADRR